MQNSCQKNHNCTNFSSLSHCFVYIINVKNIKSEKKLGYVMKAKTIDLLHTHICKHPP